MTVDHTHVDTIAIEPNERLGLVSEACVVVTRDTYVVVELRETAGSAVETFWNLWHVNNNTLNASPSLSPRSGTGPIFSLPLKPAVTGPYNHRHAAKVSADRHLG
jgi:hypothetical protein